MCDHFQYQWILKGLSIEFMPLPRGYDNILGWSGWGKGKSFSFLPFSTMIEMEPLVRQDMKNFRKDNYFLEEKFSCSNERLWEARYRVGRQP